MISPFQPKGSARCLVVLALICAAAGTLAGCGGGGAGTSKKTDFFTSGSREADQRASQTMAKSEQLSGSGEGAGEKGVKKAVVNKHADESGGSTNRAAQAEGKLALFQRLGGEAGLSNIVADFTTRAVNDPRVNWTRKGVKSGGWFHRGAVVNWDPSAANVAKLQKHLVQFLALATGGPTKYDGKEMVTAHAGMHISNPEFDATIGDLKATLDKLQVPNKEQKELLAIVESTRPQIVEKR
jgi:hemoglobin